MEPESPAAAQARAQEQALFVRNMEKDDALFRLQLAMAWATFLMIPADAIALIVYPPALAGMIPLSGLAAWNWRRILRRNSAEVEVITKCPDDPQ